MKRLTAITSAAVFSFSLLAAPTASASGYTYFTAKNGVTFPVIKTASGSEGTLVFLNGDGTRRYTSPDSDFVKKITKEVAGENVDCLFLLPPNNEDSWWGSYAVHAWSDAMREYLNSLETPAIEITGYSGGAEFIGRHLTLKETDWIPANTSFTMIGGGSIGGFTVNPPAPGKEGTKLDWVVGQNDTWLRDQPSFNARSAAQYSESEYRGKGFRNTKLELVPADHYNYDFAQIVGDGVREMKNTSSAPHKPKPPVGGAPAPAPKPKPSAPAPAPTTAKPPKSTPKPTTQKPTAPAPTPTNGAGDTKKPDTNTPDQKEYLVQIRIFFRNMFRKILNVLTSW